MYWNSKNEGMIIMCLSFKLTARNMPFSEMLACTSLVDNIYIQFCETFLYDVKSSILSQKIYIYDFYFVLYFINISSKLFYHFKRKNTES